MRTAVGTYGLMPEDLYLRKIEKTKMFDDKNMLYDYNRNILRDLRPDKPFFESDAPRRNSESRALLNLRHGGARTLTEPWLPDGTNLNFDSYCIDTPAGPDMQKYVAQERARTRFINFYPDSDYSVPESGISPARMVKNIKSMLPWAKERMKFFQTAKDNIQHGGGVLLQKSQDYIMTTPDGQIIDLAEADAMHRSDCTTRLSTQHLGYRTNTDHRFKVAKYGIVRSGAKDSDQNWYRNRTGAHVDHRLPVSWEGMQISQDLVLTMANILRKKKESHKTALQTMFGSTKEIGNKRYKITPNDMAGIMARQSEESQALVANMLHEDKLIERNGERLMPKLDLNKMDKVVVNRQLVEFIKEEMSNRKMAPRETKDLRDKIEMTASDQGIFVMDKENVHRTANVDSFDLHQNRQSIDQHYKGESKDTFNYQSAPLPKTENDINISNFEDYKTSSKEQDQRTINTNSVPVQQIGISHNDGDYGILEGQTKDKMTGILGSKYMRRNMTYEMPNPDLMNDY